MSLSWECVAFDELSPAKLYALMRLRQRVFVVEQNCPYVDADNKDQGAFHLVGTDDGVLAAYARLLRPGVAFEDWSIGRVITSPEARGTGAGRQLMVRAIAEIFARHGGVTPITIGAQARLEKFYASLGFITQSEVYLEDNIEHVDMRREATPL